MEQFWEYLCSLNWNYIILMLLLVFWCFPAFADVFSDLRRLIRQICASKAK